MGTFAIKAKPKKSKRISQDTVDTLLLIDRRMDYLWSELRQMKLKMLSVLDDLKKSEEQDAVASNPEAQAQDAG